jgi:hypothetical protein
VSPVVKRGLTLAALALTLAANKSDPLAGRVAGAPVDCISLSPGASNGPQIVDDHTILYRQSGKRTWRTGPVGHCPGLRPFSTMIVDVYGSQLCRNDRFRMVEPGLSIPGPYCRLDRFTPYDKK